MHKILSNFLKLTLRKKYWTCVSIWIDSWKCVLHNKTYINFNIKIYKVKQKNFINNIQFWEHWIQRTYFLRELGVRLTAFAGIMSEIKSYSLFSILVIAQHLLEIVTRKNCFESIRKLIVGSHKNFMVYLARNNISFWSSFDYHFFWFLVLENMKQ